MHGFIRRSSSFNTQRIDHIYQPSQAEDYRLVLHYADLSEASRLVTLLNEIQPHEVYNLAAQSHVRVSLDEPEYTGDITALGSIRLLEAIRAAKIETRYYQASSSEMFGATRRCRTRTRRSIPVRRAGSPSCMRTGSRATTVRRTACSP